MNRKYQDLFTKMLTDLKRQNTVKWAEIAKREKENKALREKIAQATKRIQVG